MNQCRTKRLWLLLIFTAGMLALAGCMTATPKPGEVFSCAEDSNVNKTLAIEAALENFSCVIQRYEGADTLHFNVAVKNISNEDQRFKVNIFLENGKAVGGLLPVKTKNGLIKPGDTATFTYPVTGMNCAPGKIDLFIKTMQK
ncbi:MAG: hypothetical protein KKE44_19270 [Proteobacteria bacterium]|nr:hypothetical protein [Pseudomonadota bacterium]MBU2456166.1 hypothetical protein [Pseudomonadota bacterium]MBU2627796.1 hypothetical protein [Pseudomonadota bacterium]